jgi:hypothetical protein
VSRTSFRSHWLFILIALVALATIAAACGGSDDDDAPEPSTAASEQSSDDEAEQSDAPAQAAEQSDEAQGGPAAEQAEPQSQAEEDGAAQAEGAAEQAAAEEQAQEQAAAEAEEQAAAEAEVEEDADADAQAQAAEGDDDGGDGGDGADGAVSSALALGDFALVEDFRLEARLTLDITPNTPDGDLALLEAFSDVSIDGAFVGPGDFEVSVRVGDGSALPPIGLISVGDRLFANLGFGWEEQAGGAGGLLEGFDLSALGVDPSGLDLEGLAAGELPFLPDEFSFDGWDDLGVESIRTSDAARSYMIEESDLETFIDRLLGTSIAGLQEEAEGALDLSAFADASVSVARVILWVDEETGTVAKVVFELLGLELTNIDDEGSDVSIGGLRLEMDILPAFGLPAELSLFLEEIELTGPDGFSGQVIFSVSTSDVNQGGIVIEPPVE